MSELTENLIWYARIWPKKKDDKDWLVCQIEKDFLIKNKSECCKEELEQLRSEIDAYKASRVGKPDFIDYFKNSTLKHPMDDILEIVKKLSKA